ncbi:MAG: preprotein translocase subunit SecG [Candidatus Hydrogenedentes bacterium]|nr:preprotein translocase subunit SecG [Candidatus Hydrogenedentota bacterium]
MLNIIFSLNTLWWLFLLLYIPACFGLIIIVLLQKGKGQGLAGAFGMGGGIDTIFGPRSSKSLPQKITYASAGIFMILALVMSILSGKVGKEAAPELVEATPTISMEELWGEDDAAAGETATTEDVNAVTIGDTEEAAAAVADDADEAVASEDEAVEEEAPAVTESVGEEAVAEEAVSEEAAAEEAPAEEAVAEEAVAEDAAAEEAPAEEAAADEDVAPDEEASAE